MSGDAGARRLGTATCLAAGSWIKASRHVTLVGEVLVISGRPGSADSSLRLRGAHVAASGGIVKVTALSGAALATFWLSSPAEAARWAKELYSSTTSLPTMSSLNRRKRHMEEICAEQALWEARIRMAQDSATQQDTPCVFHNMVLDAVAEKEQELTRLSSDTTKISSDMSESSSESESLDRHQIDKLEQIWKDRHAVSIPSSKESRNAVLLGRLDAFQTTPIKLSLNREEITTLEHEAVLGEGKVADLPQLELGPARPAVRSQRLAEPRARQGDMVGSPRSCVAHLREPPKISTVGLARVEEMRVATTRIAELEKRLARSTPRGG